MRQSLPDLQSITACAADGATYFAFRTCELRYWPEGHIVVAGSIDADTAKRLAEALADVLHSELAASDLDFDGPADDEPDAFDPF